MFHKKTPLLLAVLLINFAFLMAQTNCDAFKKENTTLKATNLTLGDENRFLKQKLEFFTELNKPQDERVTPFSDKIDVKIVSVKGNRVSQTVTVNYILINHLPNQDISFGINRGLCKVFDSIGNELILKDISIGNSSGNVSETSNSLFTDVALKCSFLFGNVLPGTEFIKAAQIALDYYPTGNYRGNNTSLTMSNLKIEWKSIRTSQFIPHRNFINFTAVLSKFT